MLQTDDPVIAYATPTVRRPPSPWLRRVAVACAVIPLTVGVLDFAAWVVTSHPATVGIGLFTLFAGFWMVAFGFVCAATYAAFQWSAGVPARRWVKTFLLTCALFASTFAAAFACVVGSSAIPPRNRVTVTNTAGVPIASFVLHVNSGKRVDLGPLQPGQTIDHVWRSRVDNAMFEATFAGGAPVHGDIGYHAGMPEGVSYVLTVQPDQYTVDGHVRVPTTNPSTQPYGR